MRQAAASGFAEVGFCEHVDLDPRDWDCGYLDLARYAQEYYNPRIDGGEAQLAKALEARTLARELSHAFNEATALNGLGIVHLMRRESKALLETAEALISLSSEQGFPYYLAMGALFRAAALAEEGDLQEGIAGTNSVLEGMRARGAVLGSSHYLATLAAAHRKAGQVEEGLAVLAEGLEFVTKTSEHTGEAELHRVKGELLLARTPADQARAEASFLDALEVCGIPQASFNCPARPPTKHGVHLFFIKVKHTGTAKPGWYAFA